MRKRLLFLVTVPALLAGCMGRQLTADIRDYTRAASSGASSEAPAPPRPADETLKTLAGTGALGEYVTLALERNPAVSAARGRWLAAKARVITESSLEDPMVMYGRFVKEVDQRRNAGFSQQIPTPPKLTYRGRAASEEAAMAEQMYMATALDVAMNVKTTFHELYYIRGAIVITNENIDILKTVINIAQAQLRAGQATEGDVLKAQIELDKSNSDLLVLQDQWETMLAEFNALLYRQPSEDVTIPDTVELSENVPEPEQLYKDALALRPEILQAGAAVRQSDAMLTLAKLKQIPDMTIGVDWMEMLMMDSGARSAVAITFGFNLPIWLNKLKAQEYEARALKAAAMADRDSAVSNALAQIKSTHYKYVTAKRLEALYTDSLVPHAEQSLKLAETGYEAAKVGILDLLDSQRTLLMLRLAQLRATVDHRQKLAELERAVGKPLSQEAAPGETQ
jgi:outer membrane protein TolC